MHRGLVNSWGGAPRGGAIVGLGSTVQGSSTSRNRPSHHKFRSPKQFELKQSWKPLRTLDARWTLPVYPFFEKEKKSQKRQTKNRLNEKLNKKDRHDKYKCFKLRLRAIINRLFLTRFSVKPFCLSLQKKSVDQEVPSIKRANQSGQSWKKS